MGEFQKNLWAPWRMQYIEELSAAAPGECFLCRVIARPDEDEKNYVLWRDPRALVLLNLFPYSSGHVLVAPSQHVAEPEDLADQDLLALARRVRDAKRVLQAALGAEGFNIGLNLGRCAGAGLPNHLHVHVVPRWNGDVNFMPVLADVKVIPQSLAAVRELFLSKASELGL